MRPGDYVRSLFDPRDRVALVAIPRGEAGGRVLQEVHPAEVLAAGRTQAWLRHLNAQRHDIFLGVNPVRPGAWGRTKAAIGDVLRVYLDIDEDGERALARIRADARSGRLPEPTHVVRSSPGRYQVLWSVPRGALDHARAEALVKGLAARYQPQHAGGPVGPLQRTEAARRKDRTRRTADGSLPVQSLADLLAGLGTLSAVELRYEQVPGYAVPTLSELEPLQERVFELLGFQPHPAPALSKPSEHAGRAPIKTPT